MQGQSCVPKFSRRDIRHPNVNGHGLHVQAMPRNPVPMGAEVLVAEWCPVAANHSDFGVALPGSNCQIVEQVEHARVVLPNVASPVIAQIVIQPCESG